MRLAGLILALTAWPVVAEEPAWKMAKGDVLRYRVSKTVEYAPAPEAPSSFLWEFSLTMKVAEVKDGVARLEGKIDAVRYRTTAGQAPECLFDSTKSKEVSNEILLPYREAVGKAFEIEVKLTGKLLKDSGLEEAFDLVKYPFAEQAPKQLREMIAFLFMDLSLSDEKGVRAGFTISMVRPGIPVGEDALLVKKAGGYAWKGTLSMSNQDGSTERPPPKFKEGWKSEGSYGWAAGRATEGSVESSFAYEEPMIGTGRVVRAFSVLK